jgi:aromatic ring-opening dioxygenase catalytic subunit (LigB family)
VKESVAADEAVAAEAAAKSEAQKAEVEADLEEATRPWDHGTIGPWDEMKPTLRLCQNSY